MYEHDKFLQCLQEYVSNNFADLENLSSEVTYLNKLHKLFVSKYVSHINKGSLMIKNIIAITNQ